MSATGNCGSCGASQVGQAMVDQRPRYDNAMRRGKRPRRPNQVLGKSGLIRPDKRKKHHYL